MKINRTAMRTVEILELIASSETDLTLHDISTHLQIPKTSTFDILETLVHLNMLYIKEQRLKTYAIGVKAYVIGNNYSKTSLLLNSSAAIIKDLSEKTGQAVLVAKEDSGKIIYTLKQDPVKKVIATPEIGDQDYLHTTSAGKAVLAYSAEQQKLMSELALPQCTEKSITSMTKLKAELFDIRTQGYATSDREKEDYLYSIAAPIFDYNGVVSAALELVCLYQDGYDPTKDIKWVQSAAKQISELLGYEN